MQAAIQNILASCSKEPQAWLIHGYKMGNCWGLPFTCPSSQDPLVVQGKLITRLGSLRLDQDELRLAPKVRSFPYSTMPDEWTDRVG